MASQDEKKPQRLATLAIHGGQIPDPTTNSRAVPIYATTVSTSCFLLFKTQQY